MTPAGEYPRIPYKEALLKYGTDKPDLRNPLLISDVGDHFKGSGFGLFAGIVEKGGVVRAVPAPGTAEKSRKFFDDMNEWARSEGFAGLGYATRKAGEWGGPIAKNHGERGMDALPQQMGLGPDDGIFFAAGKEDEAAKLAGAARTRVGEQLDLIEKGAFRFCWIVDFPMFEYNDEQKKIDFCHNPFSMPQGGMEALESKDPLDILAWQYDIVCNGVELSSGAIRNHRPDIMYKAFEIAGYTSEEVDHELRRHDQRLQVRRSAARRIGAGHRPHRHADRRRAQHPRSDPLPDEPEGRGSDDERAGGGHAQAAQGAHIRVVDRAKLSRAEPAVLDDSLRPASNYCRFGTGRIGPAYGIAGAAFDGDFDGAGRAARASGRAPAAPDRPRSPRDHPVRRPEGAGKKTCAKAARRSLRSLPLRRPLHPHDRREAAEGHWLARFWSQLPSAGDTAVFFRSWYRRVLDDRMLGPHRRKRSLARAFDEINEFEAQQRDYGTLIVKLYFDVSAEVQEPAGGARDNPWQRGSPQRRSGERRDPGYAEALEDCANPTRAGRRGE